jgi:hypothetical protein
LQEVSYLRESVRRQFFKIRFLCPLQATSHCSCPKSRSQSQKKPCKSRTQIKADGIQKAIQWQELIGTNGIESKADQARYIGISQAIVTQVLRRLFMPKSTIKEVAEDFTLRNLTVNIRNRMLFL